MESASFLVLSFVVSRVDTRDERCPEEAGCDRCGHYGQKHQRNADIMQGHYHFQKEQI